MRTFATRIISKQFFNSRNGQPIVMDVTTKGQTESVPQAIISTKEGNFWLPAALVNEDHDELVLKVHEPGDTFVAARDSSRTKAEAYAAEKGVDLKEAQAKLGAEADEPLYLKGETVTRTKQSYEPTVTQKGKLSQREMLEILAKSGANLSSLFTA